MNQTRDFIVLAVILLLAGICPCLASEGYTNSVTIKPDGSAVVRNCYSQPRSAAEAQVRQFQQSKDAEKDDDDAKTTAPAKEQEEKPLSDTELQKQLRAMFDERRGDESEGGGIESLQISKETVVVVMTNNYGSLEQMLGREAVGGMGMRFINTRFEKDTNSHLRITFTPSPYLGKDAERMRSMLKMSDHREAFSLILPGKILSSDFPITKGNTTGFALDTQNDESLDGYIKVQSKPAVVIAELGGLSIETPLDSKNLWRKFNKSESPNTAEMPVTDAAPGFVVEANGVTTTLIHYFAGGKEYVKKEGRSLLNQPFGVTINAKIFPPKGHTLEGLSNVRVIKAVDDKGREIGKWKLSSGEREENDNSNEGNSDSKNTDDEESGNTFSNGDSERSGGIYFRLQLALPKSDAEAIAEVTAEAIASTTASWKELKFKDLKKNATNEFDLSEIIPGAKLVVTKFKVKKQEISMDAEIEGPAVEVQKLKLQLKFASEESSNSNVSERNSTKNGSTMVRKLSINAYQYSSDDSDQGEPELALVVRYPQGQKRERVRFKVTDLDLF